jgi:hypothetical protein
MCMDIPIVIDDISSFLDCFLSLQTTTGTQAFLYISDFNFLLWIPLLHSELWAIVIWLLANKDLAD